MLGSRLDNQHPYGVRVVTGREKTSAATDLAAKSAARKADRLLAKLAKPSTDGEQPKRARSVGR
jgi:hypothetical protein